jgi:hypothetical protein
VKEREREREREKREMRIDFPLRSREIIDLMQLVMEWYDES